MYLRRTLPPSSHDYPSRILPLSLTHQIPDTPDAFCFCSLSPTQHWQELPKGNDGPMGSLTPASTSEQLLAQILSRPLTLTFPDLLSLLFLQALPHPSHIQSTEHSSWAPTWVRATVDSCWSRTVASHTNQWPSNRPCLVPWSATHTHPTPANTPGKTQIHTPGDGHPTVQGAPAPHPQSCANHTHTHISKWWYVWVF